MCVLTEHRSLLCSILRYCRRVVLVLSRLHLRFVPRCLPHQLDYFVISYRPSSVVSLCSGIACAYTISTHCYILSPGPPPTAIHIPTSLYLFPSPHCTSAHHTSAVVTWTHTPSAQLRHGHSYIPLRLLRISFPFPFL